MNERQKVAEAEFFLDLMKKNTRTPETFAHCLSAFLSAGRSVLVYALNEIRQAAPSPGKCYACGQVAPGQETRTPALAWYEAFIAARPVLKCMRDERNVNLHVTPVTPVSDARPVIESMTPQTITVGDSFTIRGYIDFAYRFTDWRGAEDVLALSDLYVQELKLFVQEAISRDYLSV